MSTRIGKAAATACGVAALLALGACGDLDRGGETTAERRTEQGIDSGQATTTAPSDDAAARAAAQRSGARELSQGQGT